VERDFAEFVDAELPRLHGLAYALTGDPHDAWDLAQETLTRIGARWPRMQEVDDPASYARTVLVRVNIDRLRRLLREHPAAEPHDAPHHDKPPQGIESWVEEALRSLTPRQRTAVVLRFVEDLDHAGIAARMGCSVGTARSHLSRGLERIRQFSPTPVHGREA